ncbi:unnamed protein product, partial [Symbiodinium necroappetens]
ADRKSRAAEVKSSTNRSAKADREPREQREPREHREPPAKVEKTPPRAPELAPKVPETFEEKVKDVPVKPEKAERTEKAAPKKRGGKAWADIPPEGTPPPSPQPAEVTVSAKPALPETTGEPESGMMPISEKTADDPDDGFEFLVGKKRKPKARAAEARTSRSGSDSAADSLGRPAAAPAAAPPAEATAA